MNRRTLIALAFGIIIGAIATKLTTAQTAHAQSSGPFQISSFAATTVGFGSFVVNTSTGQVSFCQTGNSPSCKSVGQAN